MRHKWFSATLLNKSKPNNNTTLNHYLKINYNSKAEISKCFQLMSSLKGIYTKMHFRGTHFREILEENTENKHCLIRWQKHRRPLGHCSWNFVTLFILLHYLSQQDGFCISVRNCISPVLLPLFNSKSSVHHQLQPQSKPRLSLTHQQISFSA